MSPLEAKIIVIMELIKIEKIRTRHLASIIYNDCMSIPSKGNGGKASSISRACKKSKFLKLDGGFVYFNKDGWSDKL